MRFSSFLTLAAATSLAAAQTNHIGQVVRADFKNVVPSAQNGNAVNFTTTGLTRDPTPSQPASQPFALPQFTMGGSFATYETPYEGFTNEVLFTGRTLVRIVDEETGATEPVTVPGVYTKLYPEGYGTPGGITADRATITSSNAVFRYKWLMYGEEPGSTDPNPAILNIFNETTDSNTWFTDADRAEARKQIAVLQEALAYDPLNRDFQSALLDIYYDWAVAEMQFARKKLVSLATVRLGILTASTFIIDEEIEDYKELVKITGDVLKLYGELFSFEMEGFNPSDLYGDSTGGAPFGYFIFQNQVPFRNQTPTQYASGAGVNDVIEPTSVDPVTGEKNYPITTFSGFKDYRTILTILGDHIRYQAELGRLRAMRRAESPDGDDITVARNGLTETQQNAATAVCLFDHMFSLYNFDDPQLDATGVRGAKATAKTALIEAQGVRSFLNGTSNSLGLDPNILLLVPSPTGSDLFDTYDILVQKLSEEDGPLQVALEDLGVSTPSAPSPTGARQTYNTFRESVDRVSGELTGLEDDFKARFLAITGYNFDTEGDQWDGLCAKRKIDPATGQPYVCNPRPVNALGTPVDVFDKSELGDAERAIDSLIRQNITLGKITSQLLKDAAAAEEAVSLAKGISGAITGAQAEYESKASSAWTEIQTWAGLAAASQSVTDGAYAVTGVDGASTLFSGGGNVAAIGIATAVNTGVQTAAATRTALREQDIDQAAIAYDTALSLAEVPLTVKQSQLELGALLREGFANRLEIEDNFTALAQAIADKAGLLREVQIIQENLISDRADLRDMFYADPIHYVRAERAILKANSSFRNAQRWVFFTCRALEYKWNERFAMEGVIGGDDTTSSFDIGSILKARNATELDFIVQKMAEFNFPRQNETPGIDDTIVISLRDQVLTPNPRDVNRTFKNEITEDGVVYDLTDDGLRYDPATQTVVDQQTRFRQILESYKDASGNIVIPVDTTLLANYSTLFPGADFSDLSNPDQGTYRNKVQKVAVNLFVDPAKAPGAGPLPDTNGKNGRITYGGNTFFRTRVPVCPDRTTATTTGGDASFNSRTDFGSEFIMQPFRFYQNTEFDGSFRFFSVQNIPSMKFAYTGASAKSTTVLNNIINPNLAFFRPELKERSVAATRWEITLNSGQVNLDHIIDIEFIIQFQAYARAQITCE